MKMLKRYAPLAILFAVGGGLLYLGWTTLHPAGGDSCSVCGRPIHPAAHVEGSANGEALTFCCAACALRAEEQGISGLQVTRVFDYDAGQPLDPKDAVAVVGSKVNLCMQEHVLMDAYKEASELHFDRCSPSVLSFRNTAAAERFQAEHGGEVSAFADVESALQ
jgi:hypothetical protein